MFPFTGVSSPLATAVYLFILSFFWRFSDAAPSCTPPSILDPAYLAMYDASGHRSNDIGDYDRCRSQGYQHCVLQSTILSGACVPLSCGITDLQNISSPIWQQYILTLTPLWEALILIQGEDFQVTATCGDNAFGWSQGAYNTAGILIALGIFVTFSTVYTAFNYARSQSEIGQWKKWMDKGETENDKTTKPRQSFATRIHRVLWGSSLMTTFPPLFGSRAVTVPSSTVLVPNDTTTTTRKASTVTANFATMNGIRVLSMSLVILGHSYFTQVTSLGYTNTSDALKFIGSAAGQVIISAEFSVDTFFLLSGTLGAYFAVKQFKKIVDATIAKVDADKKMKDGTAEETYSLNGGAASVVPLVVNFSNDNDRMHDDDIRTHSPTLVSYVTSSFQSFILTLRNLPNNCRTYGLAFLPIFCGGWLKLILRRWLRIVPSLGMAFGLYYYLIPAVFGVGPFAYAITENEPPCGDKGWYTMLFLSNFLPDGDKSPLCPPHTWYLVVEGQLFFMLLAPFCFLYVLAPRGGWSLLLSTLIACISATFYIVYDKKLSFVPVPIGDLTGDYGSNFYMKPWTRAPAFLSGIGLGFALLDWEREEETNAKRRNDNELSSVQNSVSFNATLYDVAALVLPTVPPKQASKSKDQTTDDNSFPVIDFRATIVISFALALLGFLFYIPTSAMYYVYMTLTGSPAEPWTDDELEIYTSVSRFLWTVGVAILIYYSAIGRGGLLSKALGHSFWKPTARLSFWIYLIHFPILYMVYFTSTQVLRYSAYTLASTYVTAAVLSSLSGALMHLIVECPAAAIEKELWT